MSLNYELIMNYTLMLNYKLIMNYKLIWIINLLWIINLFYGMFGALVRAGTVKVPLHSLREGLPNVAWEIGYEPQGRQPFCISWSILINFG